MVLLTLFKWLLSRTNSCSTKQRP